MGYPYKGARKHFLKNSLLSLVIRFMNGKKWQFIPAILKPLENVVQKSFNLVSKLANFLRV